MVVRGAGRGAQIGFPTANLEPVGMVLPPLGVYAGRAWLRDAGFVAAIHIGPNPTFGEERVKFEVHLVGSTGRCTAKCWLSTSSTACATSVPLAMSRICSSSCGEMWKPPAASRGANADQPRE